MKQEKIIKAYIVLTKLAKLTMPLSIANKIFNMKEILEPQYTFQQQEEQKSFDENQGSFTDDNKVIFKTVEDRIKFDERMNELKNLDVDLDIHPIDIPINDDILLSADEIKDLSGIVNFV